MGRIAGVTAEDTRRRLLDAAAAEFDRRGFEGARVADIAAGADLSNGAMYRHFRGKSDLLSAALTDRGARELTGLFAGADGSSIAAVLASIGRSLERMPTGKGGLMVEALVAARRDSEVAEVSRQHLTGTEEWLAGLIGQGQAEGTIDPSIDAASLARFCVMLVLGATLLAPVDLEPSPGAGWTDLIGRIAESLAAPPE